MVRDCRGKHHESKKPNPSPHRNTLSRCASGCVALIPASQAGMLSAEQVVEAQNSEETSNHRRIANELSRTEVQSLLVEHGVSLEMARERVAALSDAEAAELAKQFDRAPAGGAFTGFLIIFFFGWAILHATDYLQIFSGDEKTRRVELANRPVCWRLSDSFSREQATAPATIPRWHQSGAASIRALP